MWLIEWENVKTKSINEKMVWLLNNLNPSLNQLRKTVQIKQNNEFFDCELDRMRMEKNRLYKIAKLTKTNIDWHNYRVYKNEYKNRIQTKKYEQLLFKRKEN